MVGEAGIEPTTPGLEGGRSVLSIGDSTSKWIVGHMSVCRYPCECCRSAHFEPVSSPQEEREPRHCTLGSARLWEGFVDAVADLDLDSRGEYDCTAGHGHQSDRSIRVRVGSRESAGPIRAGAVPSLLAHALDRSSGHQCEAYLGPIVGTDVQACNSLR